MAFKIVLQEVNIESVEKGRTKYQIANVVYTFNGANKSTKIMSFANPQVFKDIQTYSPGTELVVETTKNGQGYDQWSKVSVAGAAPPNGSAPSSAAPRTNTYETPEERKLKQLYIIKQSSISTAVATLSVGSKVPPTPDDVLKLAQIYVDFVYGNENLETQE